MSEIKFHYIQPGKLSQNAYVDRFNRSFRSHVLDAYSINNLNQVREMSNAWIVDYNNHRPHDVLRGLPPRVYSEKQKRDKNNITSLKKKCQQLILFFYFNQINRKLTSRFLITESLIFFLIYSLK